MIDREEHASKMSAYFPTTQPFFPQNLEGQENELNSYKENENLADRRDINVKS